MNGIKKEKKAIDRSALLIWLCWLIYTCAYLGKLSYNANINQIGEAFGATYSQTGLVSTCFFFAYGIGQVVNGFMCKRYNVKLVIFAALLVSGGMNLLVGLSPDFGTIKYFWLINGAAASFLWTSIIRLLSETLSEMNMSKAVFIMGTTVSTGTLLIYGISSLLAGLGAFKVTFYIASGVICAAALVWIFSFDSLVKPLKAERGEESAKAQAITTEKKVSGMTGLYPALVIMGIFAVSNNMVKDGITTWTPDILSAIYNTPGWLSILLTLLLPIMGIGGAALAMRLRRSVPDFISMCTALFVSAGVLIGVVMLLLNTGAVAVTVGCFAVVSCLMMAVNNIITSMVPLSYKDRLNSGKLAGILNGCCYLGSTVSTYSLGMVADSFGWVAVFWTLISVTALAAALGGVYMINKKMRKQI